ncbi:acetate/propionate family kinase [Pseudodesulfovibrio piezophilus]|uniref:Acetate kinase n=1 Tax=Pseudodesulfovibrio piezophilus (strain DSM 21447 / JCM 15486 / C1TLV30) TaxID=1322246 RepID=M1WSV2_PSEP2|nr:acetate kinase [Pseudodesulfovibrio piezophilus]CCH50389.1 Acetate kinase [Pseudodesulfovibrio piezophilus C1TLV30]
MKVLVINSGSSSIKYQLLDTETEAVMVNGLVERIGEEVGDLKNKAFPGTENEVVTEIQQPIPDHNTGMRLAIELITDPEKGVLKDKGEIGAIGHRVVHGGEDFHKSTVITDEVIAAIEACVPLAPLHNSANLDGIRVAMELFPEAPQVAVFDTAFHQTIPAHAYMYALPYALYEENRIRRYGFHGTSHKFVAGEMARLLGKPLEETNMVTVHLGNGGSITAVENGQSVDTSMGMTPLEGLVMGTRSGDVDPAVHTFLARNKGMDIEQIDTLLNKESGLKGLCGMNDMRDIHAAIEKGDKHAEIALGVQTYRNRKYIGAYMAVLGRVDAIVFTAGIGENDDIVRRESLKDLEAFGVEIDQDANAKRGKEPFKISTEASKVAVWVIPTNEELAIAREAREVLSK